MANYEKYRVKVLEKAFLLLAQFKEFGMSLSVKELSESLGYNKTSTLRLIRNLEEFAYLERVEGTQRYKLGFGIYCLGQLAESYEFIRKVARPFLNELCDLCEETVHLAVLKNGQALYIDKIESQNKALRIISEVGTSLPCHSSGLGKILLSALDDDQVDRVIEEWGFQKFTENTIVDECHLLEELNKIREQGYGTDNEEIEYGLKCVAAPIFDKQGNVVAAVSVSGPKERMDHNFNMYIQAVKEAACRISENLVMPSN